MRNEHIFAGPPIQRICTATANDGIIALTAKKRLCLRRSDIIVVLTAKSLGQRDQLDIAVSQQGSFGRDQDTPYFFTIKLDG